MQYKFSDEIEREVRQALISDSSFAFKQAGENLRRGICPNCGERECFVDLKKPWRVSCGRLNNCQWSETTRNLYPNIFENLSKRHPATEQNPNATADAYMTELRGFSSKIIDGMYSQAYAKHQHKKEFYAAVKIGISANCYWLRIIDAAAVRKNGAKSKIIGDYKYDGWIPPKMEFKEADEIWITEGIFKSMAFLHLGMKSISGLSAHNLPLNVIKKNAGKNITWILAEDNDAAGISFTRKYIKILQDLGENYRVAFAQIGEDWDDVFRDERLNEKYIQDSFFRGFYNMADSYQRKAFYHYCKYKFSHSVIDFRFAMFTYKKNNKKYAENEEDNNFKYPDEVKGWNLEQKQIDKYFALFNSFVDIREICPCKPQFLYIEKDIITQERTNCFHIEFANHTPSMLFSTDGTIYKSADNFSNGLLRYTGFAPFNGNTNDLNILHKRWFRKRIKFVQSVPFAGYEPSTQIYVFPDFAYFNGVHQKVNKHGFYTFNRNSVKCSLSGLRFRTNVDDFNGNWINDFYHAFDKNGMVLLAWWIGTLFAEQIRKKQDSWPFLEYTGDPGSGKSTQLRFMWRCLGVEGYEGFDPNKTTAAGRARQMTQGSNLPTVLLEADRHDGGRKNLKSFDFSELKNLFNGGVIRTTGVKTAGAETKSLEFRGGICISQNAEVEGEEAILERIVHCHCTKAHFNKENADMANKLRDLTATDLGGFIHVVLRNERKLLDGYLRIFTEVEKEFRERDQGRVNNWRILLNHAQIAAWVRMMPIIFGDQLSSEQLKAVEDHIFERAASRQSRLAADHPLVQQFWDQYEYLNNKKEKGASIEILNHMPNSGTIAINFSHYQQVANSAGLDRLPWVELKQLLKVSKNRKFIKVSSVRSKIFNDITHCWTFQELKQKKDIETS